MPGTVGRPSAAGRSGSTGQTGPSKPPAADVAQDRVGGGADDRDRARMEGGVEVADGHGPSIAFRRRAASASARHGGPPMHELLTAAEMAEADRRTIAGGVPGMTLMEAAGRAVAEGAAALAPEGPVVVVAGPGNNGGDGFVAARRLAAAGREVRVVLLGDPARLGGDARVACERWPGEVLPAGDVLPAAALVVDALFGAGLDRPLEGRPAALVAAMGRAPQLLAVDLPSGVHADTGAVLGAAVRADATVTFFRKKLGHLLYPGRGRCGRLTVADIGIDAGVLAALAPSGVRERAGALGGGGAAAGARGPQVPARARAGGLGADGAHRGGAARGGRGAAGGRRAGDAALAAGCAGGQRGASDRGDAAAAGRAGGAGGGAGGAARGRGGDRAGARHRRGGAGAGRGGAGRGAGGWCSTPTR